MNCLFPSVLNVYILNPIKFNFTNYEQTNELRTNTMNTTTSTRINIFARSCNDDYSPAIEDLCVKMRLLSLEANPKMRLLSLEADPKMEALDAKLEQAFYEDKIEIEIEDNSRDESNEETFGYTDDAEDSHESCVFNTRYGTCFSAKQLDIFNEYAERTGLKTLDAINYMQSCHSCGSYAIPFGNEYCNRRCSESVEDYRYECFNGDDCLICHGYPKTTCYWAKNGCDKCDAYDGPEEERYPYSCTYCLTQMTDHEGYDVDYQLYCNNCAEDLFDKTGHLEDSRKRHREPEPEIEEEEEEEDHQIRDLTDESCDIWELSLEINNGDKEAALDMIEDQDRLMAHPRIIEYYRAKKEECSSECSAVDEDLQERKRARHIRFESVDLDSSDDEEDNVYIDEYDVYAMEEDAYAEEEEESARHIHFEDSDDNDEQVAALEQMVVDLLSEDDDVDDESTVILYGEDDSSVASLEDEEPVSDSVTMSQTAVSSMVTMIQELQDENAALKYIVRQLRSQRRMLFPDGSSISFTDDDGERYINIHAASPYASAQSPLTMADLEGDLEANSNSDDSDYDFAMDVDDSI